MKTAHFDCFAGVSGDMTLGAMIDAGLNLEQLEAELRKLNVAGFTLTAEKVTKNGISGTQVQVHTEEQKAHRHLKDIRQIIESSTLAAIIKERSLAIFERLAEAEATVHNTTPEKIHFHEVGALDAIVDVVGAVTGLHLLGVERVTASSISIGTGFVNCEHGRIPVPAPATMNLLNGLPLRATGIEAELTTPTGAAIISTLADEFGPMPPITPAAIGYGAGQRDLEIPNLLRLVIGESESDNYQVDRIDQIEANIDDLPAEHFELLMERLFDRDALDVTLTSVLMKKGRPGSILTVLAPLASRKRLIDTIFANTTTLGLRLQTVERRKLPRTVHTVTTSWGEVRVKVARMGDAIRNIAPEYDDCKRIARAHDLPLEQVYEAARNAAATELE